MNSNNDTEIFAKILEVKQKFPMIANNKDRYYERTIEVPSSIINTELQAIVQKIIKIEKSGENSYRNNRNLQPEVDKLVIKICTYKKTI